MSRTATLGALVLTLSFGCDAFAGGRGRPSTTPAATPAPAAAAPSAAVPLPAIWPTEVQVYPGATVIKHEGTRSKQHIDLHTTAACTDVIDWYKGHLPGFKLEIAEPTTAIYSADGGKWSVSMSCNTGTPNFVLINSIRL